MKRKFLFPFSLIILSFLSVTISSCGEQEDDALLSVENYVERSVTDLYRRHALGKQGCYELVFPVEIAFADGSMSTVSDHTEIKELIKAWREAGGTRHDHPSFVYPIQVIDEDGNMIDVEDQDALKELRSDCKRDRVNNHKPCFKPVFPITFEFIDGSTFTAESPVAFRRFIHNLREARTLGRVKATMVFPITIEYENGDKLEVGSKEELRELVKACRDGE